MTPEEVKNLFEEIIDDAVSEETAYTLMQNADDELRDERDWYFLREATTIARLSSDTYTTAHSLPANFDRVRTMDDAIRSDSRTYYPIDIDRREEYKDSDGFYYLKYDIATGLWQIFFTGTGFADATVHILYQKQGTAIEEAVEDTAGIIVWPGKRGAILAWQMAARVSGGIDGDELNFRMSPEQKNVYAEMLRALRSWDTKIRLRAMNGRAGFRQQRHISSDNRIDRYGGAYQ